MMDNISRARLHDTLAKFRKLSKPPFGRCMWWKSECQQPVSSHSVSRAWLVRLAEKGHVVHLQMKGDVANGESEVIADLVGINTASVFPGFCAEHDSNFFKSIDFPLSKCLQRECDLLAFRSICREAYTKCKVASFNISKGMLEGVPTSAGELTLDMMLCSTDLLARKVDMEQALDDGIDCCYHYVIEFEKMPIVAVSATFNPQVSFDGSPFLVDELEWITITILPATTGGFAVFSWEKSRSTKAVRLLDSLLRVKLNWVSDMLLRYVIDNSENAFYAPAWWDGLGGDQQFKIIQRYKMTLLKPHARIKDLYKTNGTPLVNWLPINQYPVT